MNPYANICAECGEHRDEHHHFVPFKSPEGCMCDPEDWDAPACEIKPICSNYVEDELFPGQCVNCEHLKECHQ